MQWHVQLGRECIVKDLLYGHFSILQHAGVDYQLPFIETLTRITSKVSTLNETYFMRSYFNTVKNQKQCVITQDEIYVKKCCHIIGERCLEEQLMILCIL